MSATDLVGSRSEGTRPRQVANLLVAGACTLLFDSSYSIVCDNALALRELFFVEWLVLKRRDWFFFTWVVLSLEICS